MTGTLAIIVGIIILAGAVYLLIKQVETRTVLLGAGFLMACLGAAPLKAFDAFATNMIAGGLIQSICSTMGFAMVLQLTACDKHLIYTMAKGLSKVRPVIIPAASVATFCINIALPTAAGCSSAVGVILIPLLISQGVHPAMAASAVMLGTFGSMLSPGLMHNPMIAKLANMDVIDVISGHTLAAVVSIIIGAVALTIVSKIRKEDKGFSSDEFTVDSNFKINPLFALLALVPIILLLLCASGSVRGQFAWAAKVGVPHVMLLGAFLCLLFTRTSPQAAVRKFFEGAGKGYADILGIIIGGGVLVSGMNALGMVDAFLNILKTSDNFVSIAATYGSFLLGVVSGSGDAAAIAFNEAVTPHAVEFGFKINQMGSLAALSGALGRTMSPIAGAAIICAGLAKVNPFELSKRIAPGMIIASVATMIILAYM